VLFFAAVFLGALLAGAFFATAAFAGVLLAVVFFATGFLVVAIDALY
jgi:hypothetical protein